MSTKQELARALVVTSSMLGYDLGVDVVEAIVERLHPYPAPDVKMALARCQMECRGRLTFADILDRLPNAHPGVEEAWALVAPSLSNEGVTVVRTDEMREAFAVAWSLADDPIAARMAFKEAYQPLLAQRRVDRRPPAWSASLGTDVLGRVRPLQDAVTAGRLSVDQVRPLLPSEAQSAPWLLAAADRLIKAIPDAQEEAIGVGCEGAST